MVYLSTRNVHAIVEGNRSKIADANYLLLYQGHSTWPGHQPLLDLMGRMSESYPYKDHIAFGFKHLAHNEVLHHDDECLLIMNLKDKSVNRLDLSTDLDHHEIDQWLKMHVIEVTFEDSPDL